MSARGPRTGAPSVLLVDDEPGVLAAVGALLSGRGFEVRSVRSGTLALEAVAAERPDLVLLDLAMEGMDGVEVCRRIRGWSRIPIIMLSARADEREKVRALDAGADDYVTKPFGTEELLARLRSSLRREEAREADEPEVQFGDLRVDLRGRRVSIRDREVHLTPTEFELLRVLVNNAGRVVTHHELLRSAMGPAYEDAVDNLRTFVRQVRQKIEDQPSRPRLIVTEPGVGYVLRDDR